jgi:multidrug efflux pump subunit AcrA (membrane-fusion protein)
VVLAAIGAACSGQNVPDVATAEIRRGEYTDVVEIRGDVRPVRTTYVMAPRDAGELLILKIARNGTVVKKGDVVAEFDAINAKRTIQEKQSELRSAKAEIEQGKAQASITLEEKAATVRKASFDVERAKLKLGDIGLVAQMEAEKNKLSLADAEQRLREAQAAYDAAKSGIESDAVSRQRRIDKIQADLDRALNSVSALAVTAPTDGTVNVLPNNRSSTPMGVPQEYRPGDKTFAGATILELPDLSAVFLVARIEESDRGALRIGQSAAIRADAVADREYKATVTDISVLARVDFMSGWPPTKQFDLTIAVNDPDGRLRPGMSAKARIDVGRVPDVLLVPAEAVFNIDGRNLIYRRERRGFVQVPVEIVRRGRDQAAISGAVNAGDRVALSRPDLPAGETGPGR